jgi:hypothetical protein
VVWLAHAVATWFFACRCAFLYGSPWPACSAGILAGWRSFALLDGFLGCVSFSGVFFSSSRQCGRAAGVFPV